MNIEKDPKIKEIRDQANIVTTLDKVGLKNLQAQIARKSILYLGYYTYTNSQKKKVFVTK